MKVNVFYKHLECRDVFFKPYSVIDRVYSKYVFGTWYIQGTAGYWSCSSAEFSLPNEMLPNWKEYTPKGKRRI